MCFSYEKYYCFKRVFGKTQKIVYSECLLRLGVPRVFVLFCVFVFCTGHFVMSTLLTTFFLSTYLQFILCYE